MTKDLFLLVAGGTHERTPVHVASCSVGDLGIWQPTLFFLKLRQKGLSSPQSVQTPLLGGGSYGASLAPTWPAARATMHSEDVQKV